MHVNLSWFKVEERLTSSLLVFVRGIDMLKALSCLFKRLAHSSDTHACHIFCFIFECAPLGYRWRAPLLCFQCPGYPDCYYWFHLWLFSNSAHLLPRYLGSSVGRDLRSHVLNSVLVCYCFVFSVKTLVNVLDLPLPLPAVCLCAWVRVHTSMIFTVDLSPN